MFFTSKKRGILY